MTTLPIRTFLGMLALTIVAAALAGWLGVQYGLHKVHAAPDLDTLLHERLDLTADENGKIESIESAFRTERREMQAEMLAANRDLAAAIGHRHTYSPEAQRAIERFHRAMIRLQEDTIRHALAMRAVLTPDQAAEFDTILAKALTTDAP
jgi:Spy/CpxP family protein refolding chaperone